VVSNIEETITTELPEGNTANAQDSYKYLGVPQSNGNYESTRKSTTNKYLQRMTQMFKSKLNEKNKFRDEHICSTGIMTYLKEEIIAINTKTRKILTMHGVGLPQVQHPETVH